MNDDFFIRFRKPPRRAFAAALYQRINRSMNARNRFAFRKVSFAAALGMALIAALTFSPTARAAFTALVREIGGITYIGPHQTAGQPKPDASQEQIVPEESMSLPEVQAKVPFEFHLPEWIPYGYTMASTVRVVHFPDLRTNSTTTFVFLTWRKAQAGGGAVELVAGPPGDWLVDLDHLQEVQINGQPAGLTSGGWSADTGGWDTTNNTLTLTWTRGNIMYQLRSASITVEDLIQIAESIP